MMRSKLLFLFKLILRCVYSKKKGTTRHYLKRCKITLEQNFNYKQPQNNSFEHHTFEETVLLFLYIASLEREKEHLW